MNLSNLPLLLAQQTGNNPNDKIKFAILMAGMALFFWFMIIQPQRKREKELKTMLGGLRPGDKVVTSGGIVGVVLTIKDKNVTIRSSDAKLEIQKTAIGAVTEHSGGETASS